MNKFITIAACLTISALLNAQTTIFVKLDGTGDGTSWTNACSLETAISVVERSRNAETEIWVQKGTYYPTKMLIIPDSVKIYGGFAGVETALSQRNFAANPTIIDGQQKIGSIFRLENSVTIDGFTIQNGNANGNPHKNGGGIWANDNVIIENCVIKNNVATLDGGGIYASGKVKIVNSTIDENTANGNGADMFGNCMKVVSNATIVMPPPIPGGSAPAVTTQPNTVAQVRVQGVAFATLSVAVSGTAPFNYQWYVYENGNSTLIPDATEAFYTPTSGELKEVQNDLAYFCVISNDYGASVSNLSGLHTVVDAFYCNHHFNGNLGEVSFQTPTTRTITNGTITQEWSDVLTASNCQKTTFSAGSSGNYSVDCRSNPAYYGDFFSWCAIIRYESVLCPGDWRIPTRQDFVDLHTIQGSYTNYMGTGVNQWAGAWGGGCYPDGSLYNQGVGAYYWSQTESGTNYSYLLDLYLHGRFQLPGVGKDYGYALRCVK